jgi:hypothetical protein
MKRIKNFDKFNEDQDVGSLAFDTWGGSKPAMIPYQNTTFKPYEDPDNKKDSVEGDEITPKVPQFDPVKVLTIILMDGDLSARAAQIFPSLDLTKALKNPEMLGPEEIDKLQQIYDGIILGSYVLRQKYFLLPDNIEVKESTGMWFKKNWIN